jgi:transcriptional regulator with XRE-family HTH domain
MRGSEPTIPTLPDGIAFTTVAERFGWNLRIARHRAGLRQQALADRIGASQAQIAAWEGGGCSAKIDSVVRLAEALDIDPGELLRETKGLAG